MNRVTHQLGGMVAGLAVTACDKENKLCSVHHPVVGGSLGFALGTLPDVLEPAFHPNHRQFFHSVAFFGLLAYGLFQVFEWEPVDEADKVIRGVTLVIGAAYLGHLLMDSTTPKSLPLFGRL